MLSPQEVLAWLEENVKGIRLSRVAQRLDLIDAQVPKRDQVSTVEHCIVLAALNRVLALCRPDSTWPCTP